MDWTAESECDGPIGAARDLLDETLPAQVAADWAERVLPSGGSKLARGSLALTAALALVVGLLSRVRVQVARL